MHPAFKAAIAATTSLPWTTVLDAIGWDEKIDEEIPIPHNAVITIKLDNSQILSSDQVYVLNGKNNRSQFAWFRQKFKNPRATLLNYQNKGIVVGSTTPNGAYYALHLQRSLFAQKGYEVTINEVPTISNIVLAAVLQCSLNIAELHATNATKTHYEPAEFSGACYTPFADPALKGCKANLFEEGSFTILGATTMRMAIEIAKKIFVLVKPYKMSASWVRVSIVPERVQEAQEAKRKAAEQVHNKSKRRKLETHLARLEKITLAAAIEGAGDSEEEEEEPDY